MEYSGAIGKNINNIPIEKIYIGMRVMRRCISYYGPNKICNREICKIIYISPRPKHYNQLVVEYEQSPGYLKIIEHQFKKEEINIIAAHDSQSWWFIEC